MFKKGLHTHKRSKRKIKGLTVCLERPRVHSIVKGNYIAHPPPKDVTTPYFMRFYTGEKFHVSQW